MSNVQRIEQTRDFIASRRLGGDLTASITDELDRAAGGDTDALLTLADMVQCIPVAAADQIETLIASLEPNV